MATTDPTVHHYNDHLQQPIHGGAAAEHKDERRLTTTTTTTTTTGKKKKAENEETKENSKHAIHKGIKDDPKHAG
jgi:hypothetical protein